MSAIKTRKQEFPSTLINTAIGQIAFEIYGKRWIPRAVRLRGNVGTSKLEHIDYAVPCFELAQQIKREPDRVSNRIHSLLITDKYRTIVPQEKFKIESVNGYVNFQLTNEYIDSLLDMTTQWFAKPNAIGLIAKTNLLVLAPNFIPENSTRTTDLSVHLLDSLFNILDTKPTIEYLLNDKSENYVNYLVNYIDNTNLLGRPKLNPLNRAKTYKEVKSYLFNKDDKNSSVKKAIFELRTSRLKERKNTLKALGFNEYKTVSESSLYNFVGDLFNKLAKESNSLKLVFDPKNPAVFYNDPSYPAPLRSITGTIYHLGYIYYLVYSIVTDQTNGKGLAHVIIAPQKIHSYIYEFAEELSKNYKRKNKLVCFDPQVSRADIDEINRSIKSLKGHFNNLSEQLLFSKARLQNKNTRKDILGLLDFPLELSGYVNNQQVPAIFDLLNQTTYYLKNISN
jgi:hypothetical protein